MTDSDNIFSQLGDLQIPVLPVIKVNQPEEIIPIGETLVDNGMLGLEITLRTKAGLDAIKIAKERFPTALVSAGTVTSVAQLEQVQDAGVDFVVTPGLTEPMLQASEKLGARLLPGIATPSELMLAQSYGLKRLKLFPAAVVGGIAMLKALGGPFPGVKFCPTGGLNAANFREHLALSNVFCVGGTWMLCYSSDGDFDRAASAEAIKHIGQTLGE